MVPYLGDKFAGKVMREFHAMTLPELIISDDVRRAPELSASYLLPGNRSGSRSEKPLMTWTGGSVTFDCLFGSGAII